MGNIRQSVEGVSNSGTSLVLTLPSKTIAGNTLVCHIGQKGNLSPLVSSVNGAHDTLELSDDNGTTGVGVYIWDWNNIVGGDTAYTITLASTGAICARIMEIQSVGTGVADAKGGATGTTSPHSGTVVTGATVPKIVFFAAAWTLGSSGWTSQSETLAGMTPLYPWDDLVTATGTADIRLVSTYGYSTVASVSYNVAWTATTTEYAAVSDSYILTAVVADHPHVNPMLPLMGL